MNLERNTTEWLVELEILATSIRAMQKIWMF